MSKPLPVSISNFRRMRRNPGYVYIDKTEPIADLLGDGSQTALFLARPRRFGKTLLVSTLEALFQGQRELFADTWIGQDDHWDWNQPARPVIRLDMSLRNIRDPDKLEQRTRRKVERIYRKFSVPLVYAHDADVLLEELIEEVAEMAQQEVVVLIDEYDTPITENIDRPAVQEDMLSFLRAFYGVLKSHSEYIHFTFMTGITRLARTGLFSGANHMIDLSFAARCSALLGFTQDELEHHPDIAACVAQGAHTLQCSPQEFRETLEHYYNGYQFARGGEPVYNPFSLIYCLHLLRDPAEAARWSLTHLPNAWAESGSPALLFRFLGGHLVSASPHMLAADLATIEKTSFDISAPHLATLMYQGGYLTRKSVWNARADTWMEQLAFPNREVEITYSESFRDWQESRMVQWARENPQEGSQLADWMRQALHTRDAQALYRTLDTYVESFPYPLHASRDDDPKDTYDYEFYYQALMYAAFKMATRHVRAEIPTAQGRADITVELHSHILICELKVNGSADEASKQALARQYASPYLDQAKSVTVFGLNFDTARRALEHCVKWDLGCFRLASGHWDREPFGNISLSDLRLLPAAERETLIRQETVLWHETSDDGPGEPQTH